MTDVYDNTANGDDMVAFTAAYMAHVDDLIAHGTSELPERFKLVSAFVGDHANGDSDISMMYYPQEVPRQAPFEFHHAVSTIVNELIAAYPEGRVNYTIARNGAYIVFKATKKIE